MHICLHKLCNSPLRSSHVRSHLTVNTTVNLKWTMRLSQCLLSHLYYSKLHKLLYQDRSLLSNVMILFTPPVEWASEWMFVCVCGSSAVHGCGQIPLALLCSCLWGDIPLHHMSPQDCLLRDSCVPVCFSLSWKMQRVCARDLLPHGKENTALCLGAAPALSSNVGLESTLDILAQVLVLVI